MRRELAEDGYSGLDVYTLASKTRIVIFATRTQSVLGEKGRRIRELTSLVQKRFNFDEDKVEVCLTAFLFYLSNQCKIFVFDRFLL